MTKNIILTVISFLLITNLVYSQINRIRTGDSKPGNFDYSITGNVHDTTLAVSIEYANIILFIQKDSVQIVQEQLQTRREILKLIT